MAFTFTAPAISQEDIDQAQAASGPRQVAKKGTYKVRLHSMRGRQYEKDGVKRDVVVLFFINTAGNYKGAELALFRLKDDPATTTSQRNVMAILRAAGLTDEEIKGVNWAVDPEQPVDDKGNIAAAFVKEDGSTVLVEGLEFTAFVDVDTRNPEFPKNVVKSLKTLLGN